MKIILAILFLFATARTASAAFVAPSLIQGKVYDKKTGSALASRVIFINAGTGDTLAQSKSNSSSGKYTTVITLEKSFTLKIVVECQGYPHTQYTVQFAYTGSYQEITADIALDNTPPAAKPSTVPVVKKPKRRKK